MIAPNPLSQDVPILLSIRDAAKALGITYSMLYELANKGEIEWTRSPAGSTSPVTPCTPSSRRTPIAGTGRGTDGYVSAAERCPSRHCLGHVGGPP